jgi:two-component system sensor histidine kinase CpxA
VEVELRRDAQRALLTVRDHGPGVPEDALQGIFKPFYRVAGDRARQSGGTGLGLAITERAVALHGGSVLAENHAQSGLVVTLELPLERAA